MIAESTARMRLCPNCANSIQEDAASCPYCKADLSADFVPHWLKRDKSSPEPRRRLSAFTGSSIPPKFMWMAAMLVVTLIALFTGAFVQRTQQSSLSEAKLKELQAKDHVIKSQETQLARTREQLNENSKQLAEIKSKFEASQKEVSAMQERLRAATREADRVTVGRSPAARTTAGRAPATAGPLSTAAEARRTAEAGVYETTRATPVYEGPSSASRVVSQIGKGTRINVVNSAGGWLEVKSKRGNPPGYVRSDDARRIARAN
jgi:hypothetical protein